MVYFLEKILPYDIYYIIRELLISNYINKIITIKLWNTQLIIDKYNKDNKNIFINLYFKERIEHIYINIINLYNNYYIKYNIKKYHISYDNLLLLNDILNICSVYIDGNNFSHNNNRNTYKKLSNIIKTIKYIV
jgi:hypothetical protein